MERKTVTCRIMPAWFITDRRACAAKLLRLAFEMRDRGEIDEKTMDKIWDMWQEVNDSYDVNQYEWFIGEVERILGVTVVYEYED